MAIAKDAGMTKTFLQIKFASAIDQLVKADYAKRQNDWKKVGPENITPGDFNGVWYRLRDKTKAGCPGNIDTDIGKIYIKVFSPHSIHISNAGEIADYRFVETDGKMVARNNSSFVRVSLPRNSGKNTQLMLYCYFYLTCYTFSRLFTT